jgi:Cdc6-like AAA superfamily ATPase
MSDQADLNAVLTDIQDVSVCIFEARRDFRELYPPTPEGVEVRLQNPQAEVLRKLNEAMMLVDDAMAIMVDEMDAMFEKDSFDIGGEG